MSDVAKIYNPVVASVAINVVNLKGWPFSVMQCPSNAVKFVVELINPNAQVFTGLKSC